MVGVCVTYACPPGNGLSSKNTRGDMGVFLLIWSPRGSDPHTPTLARPTFPGVGFVSLLTDVPTNGSRRSTGGKQAG